MADIYTVSLVSFYFPLTLIFFPIRWIVETDGHLGNHFIADLKKTFKKEDELINLISNKVVQLGIMDNINKNHINEIINIEELRSNDEDFELF